jgi:hypothetical protein
MPNDPKRINPPMRSRAALPRLSPDTASPAPEKWVRTKALNSMGRSPAGTGCLIVSGGVIAAGEILALEF